MEKEQLNEELTEEVAGGAKGDTTVESQIKEILEKIEASKINVKCAKCGKEFGYIIDEGPLEIKATAYWERQRRRRTCPHCGYVNSSKELGI